MSSAVWADPRSQGESVFFKSKKSRELKQPTETKTERRTFHHQSDIASVIVEDDERVRKFWKEFFYERGMKLYLYDSEESFLDVYQIICFPMQFYFDQDFGRERGVGVRLANLVKNSPYRVSTNLITSYPAELFSNEIQDGVLDSVLPKYPGSIFGANFFKARMRKECDERGEDTVVAECVGQVLHALEPLSDLDPITSPRLLHNENTLDQFFCRGAQV